MRRSAVAFALLWAACYRPDLGRCEVTCADGTTCPDGWTCNTADHYCHTADDSNACGDASVPPSGYTAISTGGSHTCAIDDQHHLWCWGYAANGQLGIGEGAQRTGMPTQVDGEGWTQVAAGDLHTCAIQTGAMRCWGRNDSGQVGNNSPTTGTPLPVGTDTDWIAVAAGQGFSCGIRGTAGSGGRAYCWGYDFDGECGDGGMLGGMTPREVGMTDGVDRFDDFVAIEARDAHACALRGNGEAYCWGLGGNGELGTGDNMGHVYPTKVSTTTPFDSIALGDGFGCALASADHSLWCWGVNDHGELADVPGAWTSSPGDTGNGTGWSALSAGRQHACAVKDGTDYCWGSNGVGQIGDATWDQTNGVTAVANLTDVTATDSGEDYSCAITGGDAYCWGRDDDGQLGNDKIAKKERPTLVGSATDWQKVAVGRNHVCGLRGGNHLWCWGWNAQGELGGATAGTQSPVPVEVTAQTDWDDVVVGEEHTCALRNNGTHDDLWCWGDNSDHQMGNGQSSIGPYPPAEVSHQAAGWSLLTASTNGVCALTGGNRYCWGGNHTGVLGNGNENETNIPTMVQGDPGTWTALALADGFGCGLIGTSLYCWGDDTYGQQARGSFNPTPIDSPSATVGPYDKISVAYSGYDTCGIASGALTCWGDNNYGMLGNNSTDNENMPTPVMSTVSSWDSVSAGYSHTCAIATGGDLYCWGHNTEDELGDPVYADQSNTPQHIGTDTWLSVSASFAHSCAIDTAHQLYCWGDNDHGTIGDGSQAEPLPVRTAR